MATIQVDLDQSDIEEACKWWAVHRVLNEGRAVACSLAVVVDRTQATGTINRVTVHVETDQSKRRTPTRAEAGAGEKGEG